MNIKKGVLYIILLQVGEVYLYRNSMATLHLCRAALWRNAVPLSIGLTSGLVLLKRQQPMRFDAVPPPSIPATQRLYSEDASSRKEILSPAIIKQLSGGSLSGMHLPTPDHHSDHPRHSFTHSLTHSLTHSPFSKKNQDSSRGFLSVSSPRHWCCSLALEWSSFRYGPRQTDRSDIAHGRH